MSTLLQQLNTETASIVEDVAKALVEVRSGGGGIGAGTIWHPDGLIVTNAHTVQRYPLTVGLVDGRTLAARLLACDQTLDLAALALEAAGLPTVKPGQSRTLQPADSGCWLLDTPGDYVGPSRLGWSSVQGISGQECLLPGQSGLSSAFTRGQGIPVAHCWM